MSQTVYVNCVSYFKRLLELLLTLLSSVTL